MTLTPADLSDGQRVSLSKYLKSPVQVVQKTITADGPFVIVESTGGSRYRIRAVDDDDDRMLMEKPDGDGWEPFIRLDLTTTTLNHD